jgi:hypothetical protein
MEMETWGSSCLTGGGCLSNSLHVSKHSQCDAHADQDTASREYGGTPPPHSYGHTAAAGNGHRGRSAGDQHYEYADGHTPADRNPGTDHHTPAPLSANACPLTGLEVSDPALLDRRPLAIKVQNAAIARPQFGLPQADIVYEHLTEAAITRFTAIYLCQPVEKIGSTRSARFIDLEIPAMYKSLMAFSGTSSGLYPKFLNADFYDREFCYGWGLHSDAFYRDTELRAQGIPIEHTLFADPAKIWAIADKLGINQRQDLQGLTFDRQPLDGGQPATHIHIPFPSRDMVVDYYYDDSTGTYLRWDEGEPHLDAASGQQISVTNVVVAYATHVDADFYEDEPRRNHPSVQIQLWGTGPVVVFRDGQAFEGIWARPKRDEMVVFRDATGQIPITLKPGNTWIELVPLPGHRWSFEASWDTASLSRESEAAQP